jgi:putative oxidoreductase
MIAGACKLQSPLLLVLRLYWGWSFFQAGKGKLTHFADTTEFFTSLHLPFPAVNAALAATTECVGGLFLMAGLATRLTAIPLTFTMIVAYLTADREALGMIFSDTDKFTEATPFLFLLVSVIVLIFGPGVFSADWLIARWLRGKSATTGKQSAV